MQINRCKNCINKYFYQYLLIGISRLFKKQLKVAYKSKSKMSVSDRDHVKISQLLLQVAGRCKF